MTYPQTFDSSIYPNLNSETPIVVSRNVIHHHYPSHRHDELEFSLVIEGKGTEWVDGVAHAMVPGTATFIMPYQYHEITNTSSSHLVLLNCMFGMELLLSSPLGQERDLLDSLLAPETNEPFVLRLTDPEFRKVEAMFNSLLREHQSEGKYRRMMLKLKLLEIIIGFERYRSLQSSKHSVPAAPTQNGLVSKLLVHLHQHYKDELSLQGAAAHFHVSKTQLTSVIRQYTGQTFVDLLHDIRVRHACSLLVSTDLALSDIAMEAGFQSTKTFYRVFKQDKRMTPKEYRMKSRHKG